MSKTEINYVSLQAFLGLYCESQDAEPEVLREVLLEKQKIFEPDGWLLLRCIVLDSSQCGQRVILPFGGKATFKEIPCRPVSPRGLTSDLSEVEAVLDAANLV